MAKTLIPFITKKRIYPFAVDFRREKTAENTRKYFFAVNYHSKLYTGTQNKNTYLDWKNISIAGLDQEKEAPTGWPTSGKNYYCILKINVSSLQAQTAIIEWVEGDDQIEKLAPIKFASAEDYQQTEARVIIGVAVKDKESTAGLAPNRQTDAIYFIQYVTSNLIMANMVFNGVPVIYPVPISGGGLNPESFSVS